MSIGPLYDAGVAAGVLSERRDVIAYLLDHARVPVSDGVYTLNYIVNAIQNGHHEGHAARLASPGATELPCDPKETP